jgi:hypothetical protein
VQCNNRTKKFYKTNSQYEKKTEKNLWICINNIRLFIDIYQKFSFKMFKRKNLINKNDDSLLEDFCVMDVCNGCSRMTVRVLTSICMYLFYGLLVFVIFTFLLYMIGTRRRLVVFIIDTCIFISLYHSISVVTMIHSSTCNVIHTTATTNRTTEW